LARAGHDLILVARNVERLDAVAKRLIDETGRSIETVVADLTVDSDLARVETILRTNASITMLVNNAGIGAVAPLLQSSIAAMAAMIALNATALTRLVYAIVPALVSRGHGAIINISSMVAISPETLNGVYGATKAFVVALSQSVHHELASKGIRIQAVLPGATATDFWDTAGLPIQNLPQGIVMSAEAMVDAALAGYRQGEFITIPSLPDKADWDAFEAARRALAPNISHVHPAERYGVAHSGTKGELSWTV
jgi:short-subunit dehydrogenase